MFRKTVAEYIISNPAWKTNFPKEYYQIKEALAQRFKTDEYISIKEFKEIARDHTIEESSERKNLLGFFTNLGAGLWYPKIDNLNTLVLNPEWVSQGVYQIINWLKNEKKKDKLKPLKMSDFKTIFNGFPKRYPQKEYSFFCELLKCYQLAYEMQESGHFGYFPLYWI